MEIILTKFVKIDMMALTSKRKEDAEHEMCIRDSTGAFVAFAILEHQPGNNAVEQVKNAGGIAIDEGRRHTDRCV